MGYAKHETIKKQRKVVSKSQRYARKVLVSCFKVFLVAFITLIIAVAGAGFGMIKGILDNAPSVDEINIVPKGFKSYIVDQDGNVTREISMINSNREYVYYEDIPVDYVNAFVAIEDERFWTHNGIDVRGIFRAFVHGLSSGEFDQGASTLTQQLIKNHVFNVGMDENTFMDKLERKIQEQYLALELEKKYSKEQIVEYYLNTIYLGRGVHGIQAASEKYFGREMTELSVSEIAVIAAITQSPSWYDPISNPEENAKRRQDVLDKMLELEYISQAEYDEACADDVYTRIQEEHEIQVAESSYYSYYEDAILEALEEDFMEIYNCTLSEASTLIFTGGYTVYSVQDEEIQAIADRIVNDPDYVSNYDRVGLEYELSLQAPDGELHHYNKRHLINYYAELNGDPKFDNIFYSEEDARIAIDGFKEALMEETGYSYYAEDIKITPQPQFSFTIIDQKTGYVKAIVGGRGDKTTNRGLNRATNSPRQPGSTFKPVAVYAPYMDLCYGGLQTPLFDEPYDYVNGTPVVNWYGSTYKDYVSLRYAIEQSMNVVAVKALTEMGAEASYEYLINNGFTTLVDEKVVDGVALTDKTQAMALGGLTYGVTTLEMTAAYATFANGGVYTKPVFYSKVVDHDGNVVIDNTDPAGRQHRVFKETTAWMMMESLKSTVYAGIAWACRLPCGVTTAGKTGTTSSNYDLWFCGMTPYYTASIWMGYDSNVSLGASSAHKYIWRDIMNEVAILEGHDNSVTFPGRPDGITGVTVCKISGKYPTEDCPTLNDYCAVDSLPGGRCEGHEFVEICLDSNMVATPTCPNKAKFPIIEYAKNEKKFLLDAPDEVPEYTEEYAKATCTLHPEEGFTITATAAEGGSISPSVTVKPGDNVTFYITPYTGYSIKEVVVNGVSIGAVSSYTFENVQANGTIHVIFNKNASNVVTPPNTTAAPTTSAPTTAAPTEAPTEATTTEAPTEASTEVQTEPATGE